jgi:hypothetical protein
MLPEPSQDILWQQRQCDEVIRFDRGGSKFNLGRSNDRADELLSGVKEYPLPPQEIRLKVGALIPMRNVANGTQVHVIRQPNAASRRSHLPRRSTSPPGPPPTARRKEIWLALTSPLVSCEDRVTDVFKPNFFL